MIDRSQLPPADFKGELPVPPEIELSYLVRSSHHTLPSPSQRTEAHMLRAAAWLGDSPHQIMLQWSPDADHVRVLCWGREAEEFAQRAPDLLGLNDTTAPSFDPTTAAESCTAPEQHQVIERVDRWRQLHRGLRLTQRISVLDALVPIIIAQRIPGKQAKQIHRRLFQHAATEPPGPSGILVPPSPSALREIGYETFHQLGLERARARLIHDCARNADRLESWRTLDTEAFYDNLTAMARIGPWTANRLLYAFGHPDAVWIGDYNLPSWVAWNLAGEARAEDARMLELLEPFRGHRARVLRLMELEGSAPPRFGPRLSLRQIQRE